MTTETSPVYLLKFGNGRMEM